MSEHFVLMNVRVTQEAKDAWHSFADEHEVTVSALAETTAAFFANPTFAPPELLSAFVGEAQRITEERKRRPGRGSGQGSGQGLGDDET